MKKSLRKNENALVKEKINKLIPDIEVEIRNREVSKDLFTVTIGNNSN